MVKTESIEALVRLLDDPDEFVFAHVRSKILQAGPEALAFMQDSIDVLCVEHETYDRIDGLIRELQFLIVKNELIQWIESPDKNLLKGICILAKYQFPELDYKLIEEQISTIEKAVWLELNGKLTCFEIVKTINKVLFEIYDFKGVDAVNHTPYHSFFNTVLEEREGTPLSLSIVYSIIAQRLGIPIYGVSFPNHFVMAYMDEYKLHKLLNSSGNGGVLFYIDAFAKGEFLSKENLEEALQQYKLEPKREFFEPCSHSDILIRTLNNLIVSYSKMKRTEKVEELKELRTLFSFNFEK